MPPRRSYLALLLLALLLPAPVRAEDEEPLAAARAHREAGEHGVAAAALRKLLEARPGDAEVLLELGLCAEMQAREILSGTSPALGRLALQDARSWFRKAIAARPDWPPPHRGLGRVAILGGDYPVASEAFGKAAALDETDGESRYQLGYALAYQNRFREAVTAFEAAEKLLGPEPRILLNMGISHAGLPDVARAEACLLRLLDGEIAAGRKGAWHASRGVLWLWRVYAREERFGRAEDVFGALADRHPDYSAAWWYLGFARWRAGNAEGAVEPFRRVVEMAPSYAEGHRHLTLALVRSGRLDEAVAAMRAYAGLGTSDPASLATLMQLVDALSEKGRAAEALALLTGLEEVYPDDPELIERRADLLVRTGELERAAATYRRAAELNPFSDDPAVKQWKVVTALMRRTPVGDPPPDVAELRPVAADDEPGEGGVLFDFEGTTAFVRMNGNVTRTAEDGGYRIERKEDPGAPANIAITLIPTVDTRPFTALLFTVRGIEGETCRVMLKDGYDEFSPRMVRIRHRDPVTFTGRARQVVTLPLDGFEALGRPELPFERSRLRSVIFEIGVPGAETDRPSTEVRVENLALMRADGSEWVLADFSRPRDETGFLPGGAATAFARTLFTRAQAEAYRADPNTFVRREILRDEFDPTMVQAGEGAFRLCLPEGRSGAAWGELTLSEVRARSVDGATAVTFRARGAVGGERLRVTLTDALDEEVGTTPASAPRMEVGGTILPGRFVLSKEWRRFRISKARYPDVDLEALRSIRFDLGSDVGNAPGTVLFLDEIRWE